MRISFQNLLSLYFTGRTNLPKSTFATENNSFELTKQELDDHEVSSNDELKKIQEKSYQFSNPILNLEANLNTTHGNFRMASYTVLNSLFSGIGAGFGKNLNFFSGISLAGLSILISFFKKIPLLNTKFSLFSYGGNLIRGPLHFFDSIFSLVGEQGSKYNLPSILAAGASLFSLNRAVQGKDNKSFEVPFSTTSGTLARTAIQHIDSMLSSKAAEISNKNHSISAFLASSIATAGLLLPEKIKREKLPWNTLEGYLGQGSSHFVDSLFSSIGNVISSRFQGRKNLALGTLGIALGMPALGSLINLSAYEIPFGTIEGKIVEGLLRLPENIAFNLGNVLGDSQLGIPLSISLALLTYVTCLSKQTKDFFKNTNITRNKIGGQLQRLPLFHLMYSIISSTGVKLSKLIPAPLLVLLGPAISFQLGEKFKTVDSKFDDLKGLMIRNAVHLWETILAKAAYKTGRIITKSNDEHISSGSILSDGRWLSDNGRILSSMAIGKQINEDSENNLLNILLSGIGGVITTASAYAVGKYLLRKKPENTEQKIGLGINTMKPRAYEPINLETEELIHIKEAA